MQKKKNILLIVSLVVAVLAIVPVFFVTMYNQIGPDFGRRVDPEKQVYSVTAPVEGFEMRFMLPEGYHRSGTIAFDAYYMNGDSYFGVYGQRMENLYEGQTKEDYYKEQNAYVLEGREDAAQRGDSEQYEKNGLLITKTIYSAYKDGSLNYYHFYLVEFQENPDVFAWVIITALPEYAKWYEEVFDEMVATAKLLHEAQMTLDQKEQVEGYGMQFRLGHTFVAEDNEYFDAYFENGNANIGIYAYDKEDGAEELDPKTVFQVQNEATLEDAESAKLVGEQVTYKKNKVNLTKEVYSYLEDGTEVYYSFYLVEFEEDPSRFAYVVIIALGDYARANETYFDEMMESGTIVEVEEEEVIGLE